MAEPSAALHDYAVSLGAGAGLGVLSEVVAELRERWPTPAPMIEILGRPQSGEILLLLRFASAHASPELRHKMGREAARLQGRLVEPSLLASSERERFYSEQLPSFTVSEDLGEAAEIALLTFRARMGLDGPALPRVIALGSAGALAALCARSVVDGSLDLPGPLREMPLSVSLQAPGMAPAVVPVRTVTGSEARLGVQLLACPELDALVAQWSALARTGRRRMPEGGRRQHPRIDQLLAVAFDAEARLRREWATNLGTGGLFVRTASPPPVHARTRLRIELTDGSALETEAEVVHAVGAEEAQLQRRSPGAGFSFAAADAVFRSGLERHLASCPQRRPRILLARADRDSLTVLVRVLEGAGIDALAATSAAEAGQELRRGLFGLDALLVDFAMPGLDWPGLTERLHSLSPELGLKVVAISGDGEGADAQIARGASVEEWVASVSRLLGR